MKLRLFCYESIDHAKARQRRQSAARAKLLTLVLLLILTGAVFLFLRAIR